MEKYLSCLAVGLFPSTKVYVFVIKEIALESEQVMFHIKFWQCLQCNIMTIIIPKCNHIGPLQVSSLTYETVTSIMTLPE